MRQLHIYIFTIHQFIKFSFFSMTNALLLFLASNLSFVNWDWSLLVETVMY